MEGGEAPLGRPPVKKSGKDEFQERDIARLLITYGGEVFDEENNISVAEYILANIQEVLDDFDSPAYLGIAQECLELLSKNQPVASQYFISHPDPNVSELAIDLIHSRHEYSPGWEEREIYLNTQKMPDLNFSKDSLSALQRFKLRKIMRLCEKNQQQLKEEKDEAKLMRLMKVQARLNQMRNDLAKELGTVVLR
jgi:DNA primase